MAEAEKKAQDDEQTTDEPEDQVVSTQVTAGPSSYSANPENPMTQW
jgi:hypothetical protein